MKQLSIALTLILVGTLVGANQQLDNIRNHADELSGNQYALDMIIKLILSPSYGQDIMDYLRQLHELPGIDRVASSTVDDISNGLFNYLIEVIYKDRNSEWLSEMDHVESSITVFLQEPCEELVKELGGAIDSLEGEDTETNAWKGRLGVCRTALANMSDIHSKVCSLIGCQPSTSD